VEDVALEESLVFESVFVVDVSALLSDDADPVLDPFSASIAFFRDAEG
jgi:hypothetical protein